MASRGYARSDKVDVADLVGFGLLVVVTLASLRFAIWRITSIVAHLIDLALSSEPMLTAERLNEGADQRWSVTVLVVALPLFLGGYAILAARLDDNLSIARSRVLIVGLGLLFVDTLVGLLGADFISIFNLMDAPSMDAAMTKIAATTLILGAVLAYAGWEISQALRT